MLEIDKLSIIHVAGTKGKGSTCFLVESLLRQHGLTTGVFSSPHLVTVRERICLNGKPVDKTLFCSAFWHVFDRLQETMAEYNDMCPGYFGVTLLIALFVFARLHPVDVVILEVGVGGEYDATNFIRHPVVCGIVSLHVEHEKCLGNTVHEIAWHKSGIMKKSCPTVTVEHKASVIEILFDRAKERDCLLFVTPALTPATLSLIGQLGIAGEVQPINAALAIQLSRLFLQKTTYDCLSSLEGDIRTWTNITSVCDIPVKRVEVLSDLEINGLSLVRFPGRCQTIKTDRVTYYLDGAHTSDSMQHCIKWFKESAEKEREMIFGNVVKGIVFRMKQSKNVEKHLLILIEHEFHRVAFCPHVVSSSARHLFPESIDIRSCPKMEYQLAREQLMLWQSLKGGLADGQLHEARSFPSIASALWWAGLGLHDHPITDVGGAKHSLGSLATSDIVQEVRQNDTHAEAIEMMRGISNHSTLDDSDDVDHVQVLVTGSMVLVGGALTILKPDLW